MNSIIDKTEKTKQTSELFVLLKDFKDSYDTFDLKIVDWHDSMSSVILNPMRSALANCVNKIEMYGSSDISNALKPIEKEPNYKITLDGGSYFKNCDFNLEITRTCLLLENASSGPYMRLPRDGGRRLIAQGNKLRAQYCTNGSSRPIVLCDDGIGTGGSLRQMISILECLNLRIAQIEVLLNPNRLKEISNIDIITVFDLDAEYAWLSERDLFWGLPRSGVSYAADGNFTLVFGIPYTIDVEMIRRRIGLDVDSAIYFRERCLELNILFWEYLEKQHSRTLFFDDCSRLKFLSVFFEGDKRIVDFIAEINSPEFSFKKFINTGKY